MSGHQHHTNGSADPPGSLAFQADVLVDIPAAVIWLRIAGTASGKVLSEILIEPMMSVFQTIHPLRTEIRSGPALGIPQTLSARGSSVRALLQAIQKTYPIPDHAVKARVIPPSWVVPHDTAILSFPPQSSRWDWFALLLRGLGGFLNDVLLEEGLDDREIRRATRNWLQWSLFPGLKPSGYRPYDYDHEWLPPRHPNAPEPAPPRPKASARPQAKPSARTSTGAPAPGPPRAAVPCPPVPVRFEMPALAFRDVPGLLPDLRAWTLHETAARWWVSNQSDDLLGLPYCQVERLEYQVRAALRVIGPLRGRALLSDEVGLGKTIEAGLVLKEYLVRGMVRKFLVLTQPSLVDQWAEELSAKFGIETATTNQALFRSDPAAFWTGQTAIVASLPTLRQPAHRAVAEQVQWDLLIVDEAHHLRNRASQAWQAVNALPRRFLLLLTATPVQNSLEELYNLVTLLQPGQLPSPREFRARFMDAKHPRQPKEPEELRRLLGQVMIRNTRANAGIDLPPRRAETAVFSPEPAEREFWSAWESEFRRSLAGLPLAQVGLWGRLVLQAAGSSPAAFVSMLEKYPDLEAARRWQGGAVLDASWRRKCALVPPLSRGEGGVVVFTQFLATQAALAEFLHAAGVPATVLNGSTPAAQRQPLTEEFRRRGGALLLTQSGTEGRNLQFSHRLVNFDLPWNPMEIEQRIGRLHRLGQTRPVHIHNFVQAGTLQEHLLQLLQEKLNLFELVVGETGLILGERYAGEDFAEEILRRWREGEGEGQVAAALAGLGAELAAARDAYGQTKALDSTLFAQDYAAL